MQEREVVLTKREVEARLVPTGTEIMIPSDTFVTITQSLGGSFTVAVNGKLARIEGHEADALGKKPLESSFDTPTDGTINENQVWEAIRNCYDPEIPVNVVFVEQVVDERDAACFASERAASNPIEARGRVEGVSIKVDHLAAVAILPVFGDRFDDGVAQVFERLVVGDFAWTQLGC